MKSGQVSFVKITLQESVYVGAVNGQILGAVLTRPVVKFLFQFAVE
jgi:hypothetical protein